MRKSEHIRRTSRASGVRLLLTFVLVPFVLPAASAVAEIDPPDQPAQEILGKYFEAKQTQQAALRGVQMEVEINAKLPKQEKNGKLRALRTISKLGKITYNALGFSGDNSVKTEVIARYLAEETKPRENNAITPANYKFKYRGQLEMNGIRVHVFDVTPRKKAEGLFRGQLWLDAQTGMPIRESGHPVKTSVMVKKMDFVQEYELHDGIAFPKHFQGAVEIRIYGRAELSVDYSNFTHQESDGEANDPNR